MTTVNPRRWWALPALVLAALAVGLDATVLGVALPTLAGDLHASTDDLQWFVASYSLVFAAVMVPGGMLGDRYGRKKVLMVALAVFGLGSVACAYAGSPGTFIAARVLLGLGGAVALPAGIGVLPVLFTEQERPRALAVVMTATMLGYPIGPILGGWLLSRVWWGWVFLMNLPVVAIGLVAVAVLLPESRGTDRPRLDPLGIVVSSAGLAALTYGIIEAGQHGWGSRSAFAGMLAGGLLLAGFVAWERTVRDPLLDLALFRSAGFTWGTILSTVTSFAMFGVIFSAPLYFQEVLGTDAMGSGLRLLPLIGGLVAGAAVADRLAALVGAKLAVGAGFAVLAAGFAIGATTSVTSGTGFAAGWTALAGLGLGLALPTAVDAALGALSPDRSSLGSALVQALRMVGGSFGAAVLGSIVNAGYRGHLDLAGLPSPVADAVRESVVAGVAVAGELPSARLLDSVRDAFVHGMDASLWACAGLAAMGIVLGVLFLPHRQAGGSGAARAGSREEQPESKVGVVLTRQAGDAG